MALAGESAGIYRHAHFSAFAPERAKAALGMARHQLGGVKDTSVFLSSKRATEEMVRQYFVEVFEPGRSVNDDMVSLRRLPRVQRAMDALTIQPGADLRAAEGTWWGAPIITPRWCGNG